MHRLDRTDALPLLAALPAFAIFTWWIADEGGYAPSAWMAGLLAIALVLGMVVALAPDRRRPSRAVLVAIAALGAYTLWSFASILWADAPGPALEGSQRTLLYLVCFTCFALLPWTPRALLVLVGALVLVIAAIGLVTLLHVRGAADPARFFIEARLIPPLGYPNASAALWTTAAMPALVLASRRELVPLLRPVLLGSAVLLLGLAVMTQSRGWLFTLPVVVLAVFVLTPARGRFILFCTPVAVALALVLGGLLEPYEVAGEVRTPSAAPLLESAFDDAARSLLLAAVAVAVAGALMVWIDIHVSRRLAGSRRVPRRLIAIALGSLALGCGVAAVVYAGDRLPETDEGSRFVGVDSPRYDLWRVGVASWREHPVVGLGQDNFAQTYITQRNERIEEARWVHSLPLRLLVHTGAIGAALFLLFAGAVGVAAAGARRRHGVRFAASLALLPAVVWLVHGSVDWFWEYPGLTGPVFALCAAASTLGRGAAAAEPAPAPVSRVRIALAGVIVLACVSVVLPGYIAQRDVREAATHWPDDPDAALQRLERARSLNPLSARPSLVEGVIAVRLGRLDIARASFGRAAAREPKDWFARFELGLVAGVQKDRRAAVHDLAIARRLNPRDRLVAEALRRARRGAAMPFEAAEGELAQRAARRKGVYRR